jgi:hypothetical protein
MLLHSSWHLRKAIRDWWLDSTFKRDPMRNEVFVPDREQRLHKPYRGLLICTLTPDVREWMSENIDGEYRIWCLLGHSVGASFSRVEDAVKFKLRFS